MKKILLSGLMLLLMAGAGVGGWFVAQQQAMLDKPVPTVLTREGVLKQIQQLNRLESTAFYIDTIVQTQKAGRWYFLWQDAQRGLFIAQGKVLAGIDLNKLTAQNVQVLDDKVILTLPPVEILSVDLAKLEVYDLQTGNLGLHPIDNSVFAEVQQRAKQQVLTSACQADILNHAQTQAQQQLETLFALMQTPVSVYPSSVPVCKSNVSHQ